MAAAPAVEVVEKQLSFDGHVQLPEGVPTAPPEETLQREDSTPTDAKGLHGGALGMHGTCAVPRQSELVRFTKLFWFEMSPVRTWHVPHMSFPSFGISRSSDNSIR